MHHSSREVQLGAALVEAADTLSEAFDTVAYLRRLSDHCVTLLDASAAGIMLIEGGETVSFGVSSRQQELALDLLEVQHHGGPCLESYGSGEPVPQVAIRAAHASSRWPDFTERALRYDIGSTFAVPLRRNGTPLGALNVFVPEPARPTSSPTSSPASASASASASADETALLLAQTLADAAALGLANHRMFTEYRTLTDQLQEALSSRVRIEQAKGMLAERRRTGMDEAFIALRQYARSNRLPIDEVATAVITGSQDIAELGREHPGPA
ncbi:GAF and ANTAR domain-containing protein [Streptomyces sp. ActVer]|uniref:GAF and ANTAR domain-containing protein n=1 Tax=Streptomyces sp. ActVer TaxID=3014558 RepID=UPI0022B375F5|nr:GAF and ANTAR domain-containing protein [Streptomyces sp. ActVer]MCZ4513871.1 GAF and ANTAR domain-containing protein [Streptomyces sp. ActVer]